MGKQCHRCVENKSTLRKKKKKNALAQLPPPRHLGPTKRYHSLAPPHCVRDVGVLSSLSCRLRLLLAKAPLLSAWEGLATPASPPTTTLSSHLRLASEAPWTRVEAVSIQHTAAAIPFPQLFARAGYTSHPSPPPYITAHLVLPSLG